MLEEFEKAASAPKLASNGNWQPIVGLIKKLLIEANKNVVINGLKMYGLMA